MSDNATIAAETEPAPSSADAAAAARQDECGRLWRYIPTLGLVRSFGSVLALSTTPTLLKDLNVDNATIGYLSLLTLPATFKFVWAPVADSFGTKRQWALGAAFGMAGSLLFLSGVLFIPGVSVLGLTLGCGVVALAYAVSDFANEGFFVCAVPAAKLGVGVAVLTFFGRVAWILLSCMIFLVGLLADRFHSHQIGWAAALGILGLAVVLVSSVSVVVFPRPEADRPTRNAGAPMPWREAFRTYMETPRFWYVVAFLILFRFGQDILLRMVPVFQLDGADKGGLALSLRQVSLVTVVGSVSTLLGTAVSVVVVKRYGVRRTIVSTSLAMLAPNLLYILIALYPSHQGIDLHGFGQTWHVSHIALAAGANAGKYFGYGLGFTCYFAVVVALAHGRYRASHIAFGNSLMLIGYVVPNLFSGVLQEHFGWSGLFIISTLFGIPGFILIYFLPAKVLDQEGAPGS